MPDSYEVKRVVKATPKRLFEAWLDRPEHSNMTGGAATVSAAIGEGFTLLDGLIAARNVEAEPYHRIVQVWSAGTPGTQAFESQVEIVFSTGADTGAIANAQDHGATVTVSHSGLPSGQDLFDAGWWADRYFGPMDAYFARANHRFQRPAQN